MEHSVRFLVLFFCIIYNGVLSIPATMVEEIKAKELQKQKVKRVALPAAQSSEENLNTDNHYLENPTAIKRDNVEDVVPNNHDWNSDEIPNDFQSNLYNDDRDLNDYEKSFQYGINKEKLDEALENAVLKSELYGGGSTPLLNQYGYDETDKKKRRKRNSRKLNYNNQLSSSDLTPKEVLELLALYESDRYQRPEEISLSDFDELNDDSWMDVPRSHPESFQFSDIGPSYAMDQNIPLIPSKNGKYLTPARKRNDPTRQIRYLTGPSKHDYFTLSQLLNNQREANVPLYHRYVL